MNINISNLHSTYKLEQRQMAVNTLMRQQTTVKGSIDMFIRSGSTGNDAGVYSPFSKEKNIYISDLLLLVINNDSTKVRKHGETYEVAGMEFTADKIPKIDTSKLSEVKVCNNILILDRIITSSMFLQMGKSMRCLRMTRVLEFLIQNICVEQSMMQLLRDMLIFGGI